MAVKDEGPNGVIAAIAMALVAFGIGGVAHLFQMTSFYGLCAGVFVGAIFAAVSANTAWELGGESDKGLYAYGPWAMFMSVASTSWFWDASGYCAIQREAERPDAFGNDSGNFRGDMSLSPLINSGF